MTELSNLPLTQRPVSTAYEYARQTIRDAILDRKLKSGTRLVQSQLATHLGISTTPVREALRDLASEGLIFFDSYRGAVVRLLNIDEVREIYDLVETLDRLMVSKVIELQTPESLDHADELVERMDATTDMRTWVELNREFHAIFGQPISHSRLADILKGLRNSAAPYVNMGLDDTPEHAARSNREHAQFVELYRRKDTRAINELNTRHLKSTLAIIEAAYARDIE